jgi:hypothetical protein
MFSRTARSGRLKGGTGLVLVGGGGGGARVAGSADSSTGSGSGSWKSVKAVVLLAPVAEVVVVVVLELSDVRDAVGEAVEPRPSVSWLALWDIGDMTAIAGSSTAPPNGWLI